MKSLFVLIKQNIHIFLLFGLIFLSISSLLRYGLIPTHDGEYHVVRFAQFDKVLREGSLYPRWAPDFNNGYGIPLFNYVYPLPNYLASLIHLFGFNFIDSFKGSLIIASFVSGLMVFLWLKSFFSKLPALVGAILFIYSPYRFVDIYVRGSVGELWAMAFFPGFLWAISFLVKEGKYVYVLAASLFMAATILSHNILGLMFFIFGILYSILLIVESKKNLIAWPVCISLMISLGLSAVFWLPALLEKNYARGLEVYNVKNNFVELYNLIFPSWGTNFSEGGLSNQMSFQIGIANLIVVLLSLLFLYKKSGYKIYALFMLSCFSFVVYLMLPYSKTVWDMVPLISYFQFPWRFLSLIVLFIAFLAAYVSFLLKSKIVSITLIVVALLASYNYAKPAYLLERSDSYYLTRSNFMDGTNSPGNLFNTKWFNYNLGKVDTRVILGPDLVSNQQSMDSTNYFFMLEGFKDQQVTLNTAYFPGWKTYVDEKEVKTEYNTDGLITFYLPKGLHGVSVVFANTPVRTLAELITLLSMVVLVFLVYRVVRKV